MSERAYPLPRTENDPRFTIGVALDIGARLEAAGYPPLAGGADLLELQLALFRFLYEPENPAADDRPKAPAEDIHLPLPVGSGTRGAPRCGATGGRTALAAADANCSSCLAARAAEVQADLWPDAAAQAESGVDAGVVSEYDPGDGDDTASYTDAQLDWVACVVCGVKFGDDETTVLCGNSPEDGRPLRAHPDCFPPSTTTEPPGDAP